MGVGGQFHGPDHFTPGRESTHCMGGYVGPSQFAQVQKISPPLGFNPQTIQPVTSHYTIQVPYLEQ